MTMHTPAAMQVRAYRPIEALIPQHWFAGAVVANGIRQHYYRTGGDKPPVVLLHGILEGALTWLRTAHALEADYDVVMIDTRGHGRSDRIESGYAAEVLVEDVAAVLHTLALGPVRLMGHSQGGATSVLVADRYPDLVQSLIVEGVSDDATGGVDAAASPGYQAWLAGYAAWLEQLQSQSHVERMLAGLTQLPPGAPLLPEDEYVPWIDNCAHLDLALIKHSGSLWAELANTVAAMTEALQRITCPVLVLKSAFFPQQGAPASVRAEPSEQPNVQILYFENTGHLIHREQFDLFIDVVRTFWDKQGEFEG